ncbi:hypothetical protein GV828_12510 [Flavobacterium sp. NST-5]|uniref:Repeat protein (TIGR03806 family) n=1 Tax=Flavobacterium ichthyis TaxID=2698827 RepID=A0ABW9ZBW0_9FLAO|nr:hypothetical protein [Flavobacterium ichthyis]NBL66022.1 hypothetical protein [Flavobacterium ichthyis]
MKRKYFSYSFLLVILTVFATSCGNDDDNYQNLPEETTPVTVDLALVPYPKLSDYHFFKNEIKDKNLSDEVLLYEPASSLFTDYAHKQRFVWMPEGTHATYAGDENALNFPLGSVLGKTFYYEHTGSDGQPRIMETRLLINKADGWKAYVYVWNEAQSDAFLETTNNGVSIPITFTENGVQHSINYKVPSQGDCLVCHKINANQETGGERTIPIGPKPQNLNTILTYNGVAQNQMAKWQSRGFLANDIPTEIVSTVDWRDTSKPLEARAKSYLDINCAHCHRDGGHCDYVPVRFNFSNNNREKMGICMEPLFQVQDAPFVINAGNADQSEIIRRINTNEQSLMMPIIGRTIVHEEGVTLVKEWINAMEPICR